MDGTKFLNDIRVGRLNLATYRNLFAKTTGPILLKLKTL
jgi:hypothetical protein